MFGDWLCRDYPVQHYCGVENGVRTSQCCHKQVLSFVCEVLIIVHWDCFRSKELRHLTFGCKSCFHGSTLLSSCSGYIEDTLGWSFFVESSSIQPTIKDLCMLVRFSSSTCPNQVVQTKVSLSSQAALDPTPSIMRRRISAETWGISPNCSNATKRQSKNLKNISPSISRIRINYLTNVQLVNQSTRLRKLMLLIIILYSPQAQMWLMVSGTSANFGRTN